MSEHANTDLTLNNLYSFLYTHLHDPMGIMFHEDGIIETDTGCYRLGYSPSTRVFFLFFGWHPDDLRAERKSENAPLEFIHKNRLWLVRGHESLTDDLERDGRQVFDVPWLASEVTRIGTNLPRILFHEGVLQQLTPTSSASLNIGYHVPDETEAASKARVLITTRARGDGLFHDAPDRVFAAHKEDTAHGLIQVMRAASRGLLRRGHHPPVLLTVGMQDNGDSSFVHDFDTEGLGNLIAADFGAKLRLIRYGFDPLAFKDEPLLWLYRASESVQYGAIDLFQAIKDDPVAMAREFGDKAVGFALNGGLESLKDFLISLGFHIGEREEPEILSKGARAEWRELISSELQGRGKFRSDFRKIMRQPDPDHFRDIEALDLRHHDITSGIWRNDRMVAPDNDRTFQLWLQRQFKTPSLSTFRYYGEDGGLIDPRGLSREDIAENIQIVRSKHPSGLILHYAPQSQTLYAHYHQPEYIKRHWLPPDSTEYFKEGMVWKMNAGIPTQPAELISWQQFSNEIDDLVPCLPISSADAPSNNNLAHEDASPLRRSAGKALVRRLTKNRYTQRLRRG